MSKQILQKQLKKNKPTKTNQNLPKPTKTNQTNQILPKPTKPFLGLSLSFNEAFLCQ